tara:strand:- start:1193 stop:2911 length:1719 start_codon:yes stop_codon:yes gene_type:complete
MLRQQLYAMRAWDSSGQTQNERIRQSLNVALARMANDVPQALVPDEEHAVLLPDVKSSTSTVASKLGVYRSDKRLLYFVDATSGEGIAGSTSTTTWRPSVTGEWDGIMHIEITDAAGQIHRRQCLEWFTQTFADPVSGASITQYAVTIDRPYNELVPIVNGGDGLEFRIHQPEFFVTDDVTEVFEPAQIFDGSRQKVWKMSTAGASRQDMLGFQGDTKGRPHRCWRGRHFQLPAPTEAPTVVISKGQELADQFTWKEAQGLRRGKWAICYTYVWGRKDEEWQKSPLVTPGGDIAQDSTYELTWAYNKNTVPDEVNRYSGISDPQFESAPSPATIIEQKAPGKDEGALVISATNIDAMKGFGDSSFARYGRTGMRIRYYVAHLDANKIGKGQFNAVETSNRFYMLCEVEPTFDLVAALTLDGVVAPTEITSLGSRAMIGGRIVWTGTELYDYERSLKHSTGYFAWKVYPQQDSRYELDFRVSRLPKSFITEQDTAPIHPEAVPTLLELSLYYVSLTDGNDQTSAQAHLNRYQDLVRVFRDRYANTGRVVEPVPISGYSSRNRYGTFGSTPLDD